MDFSSAPYGEARRYRLKPTVRAFYLLFALLGILFAGIPLWTAQSAARSFSPSTLLFTVFGLLFTLFFGLSTFLQFVELDHQSVSTGGLFGTRSLRLDAVKGRRTVNSRNGSYLLLESKNPEERRLTISSSFDFDERWNTSIQTLPDLDELDRKAVIDAIAEDPTLGGDPHERLNKLSTAKTVAIALSVLAVAVAVALFLAGHNMSVNVFGSLDLLLTVLPWIALLLLARSPLLYTAISNKRDPRATLMFVLLASGIGLLASPFASPQSVAMQTLWAYACIPGLLLTIALYTVMSNPRPPGAVFLLLIIGCLYGFGVTQQANTQLDNSTGRRYSSQVLRKTISSGRSTTYYLYLSPWEQQPNGTKVSVSGALYRSLNVDDPACITAHEGTLHIGWYTVESCN